MNFFHAVNATPPPVAVPVGISLDDRTFTAFRNTNLSIFSPFAVDLPATAAVGDLVLVFASTDAPYSGRTLNVPFGWTEYFEWNGTLPDNTGQLWSKVMTTGDITAGTVSITPSRNASSRDVQCWSMIATGVDKTSPVSNVGTKVTTQTLNMTLGGITPSADGLAVGFWGFDGGDGEPTTLTSGWTKLEEEDVDPSSTGLVSGFASKGSTSGVATGDLTVGFLVSDGAGGIIVNLRAA